MLTLGKPLYMKQSITLLVITLILFSCSKNKEEQKSYSDSIVKHFTQWDDPRSKQPQMVPDSLVQLYFNQLAKDTIVPSVRFNGAFAGIKERAATDELLHFASDKNPIVRCHAYTALAERGYPAIHRICFEHFNDTIQKVAARVEGGTYQLSVRTWMLYTLRPGGGSQYSFEPKLYRRYMYEYNDLSRALKNGMLK